MLQVAELEAQLGHPAASQTGREELKRSLEELEALLKAKDQVRRPVQSLHCTLSGVDINKSESVLGLYANIVYISTNALVRLKTAAIKC